MQLLWRIVIRKELKSYKSDLYAKNMKGIVGYIKTHAKKYSNKIDRLNEMKSVLKDSTSVDYDLNLNSPQLRI